MRNALEIGPEDIVSKHLYEVSINAENPIACISPDNSSIIVNSVPKVSGFILFYLQQCAQLYLITPFHF